MQYRGVMIFCGNVLTIISFKYIGRQRLVPIGPTAEALVRHKLNMNDKEKIL